MPISIFDRLQEYLRGILPPVTIQRSFGGQAGGVVPTSAVSKSQAALSDYVPPLPEAPPPLEAPPVPSPGFISPLASSQIAPPPLEAPPQIVEQYGPPAAPPGFSYPPPPPPPPPPTQGYGQSALERLPPELANMIMSRWPQDQWENAAMVLLAESGGRPSVKSTNVDPMGTTDYGLWQINDYWQRKNLEAQGYTIEDMLDPEKSMDFAHWLWQQQPNSGWNPWQAARNLGLGR